MFKRISIFLILLVITIKQLTWVSFIPIFQTPDEQAHFAEVSVVAETNLTFIPPKNTSQEIFMAEKTLEVLRDSHGNNKYTYHPEFNIPYSNTTTGVKENEIIQISKSDRKNFILNEATDYPKSYYLLGALIYKIFDGGSLFDRVFAVRIISLFSLVALSWVAYKIGQLIFDNQKDSFVLSILVGFMPMLSFVHSGVTSDTLFNLLFALFIWRCLMLIKNGIAIKELFYVALIIAFSFWTKPQANILAFILIPLLFVLFIFKQKSWNDALIILVAAVVSLFGIISRLRSGASIFPETEGINHLSFSLSQIIDHLRFTFNHTYHEVLPWFWGVFRWLSLALPDPLRKITNFLTIISFIGFAFYLLKIIIKKQTSQKFWMTIFLLFSLLVYFAAITAFDFGFRQSHGYSFGIQGRYFFPVIVPFFAIFLIGIKSLLPNKIQSLAISVLGILMIVFNVIVFFYLTGSYYQLSFLTFLIQASQYKPLWLKYPVNLAILATYGVSCVWLCLSLARSNEDSQDNDRNSQNLRKGKRLLKEN